MIEFLISAPENPIRFVKNGQPVYQDNTSEFEKTRVARSGEIVRGVLRFAEMWWDLFGASDLSKEVGV